MNQPSNSALIWNQWLKPALGGSAALLLAGTVLLGGCGQKPQPASPAAGAKDGLQHTFRQLMTIRQTDLRELLKAGDFIQQQAARATEMKLSLMAWLIRGLGGPLARETGCLATLRLGLTAVALEQFRAAHSRYPDTLSELSPEYSSSAPVDPFDGQPLRYKKKADGYLLYSIGPDLKDNSGERMKEGQGDLVFAVVAPQNHEPGLVGPVTRR